MDDSKSQYQVGGSLSVNISSYVVRRADSQLYEALLRSEFCYVFNSRQMGKSSLRVRVKNRLEGDGFACVSLDMTNIGSQAISPLQWYKSLAAELWRGFGLMGKVKFKSWWELQSELSPVQQLNRFISDIVLPTIATEKIFIFIDEIDSVLSLDFSSDDFFALIRYFYNARAELPQFNRLSFALFGVATPSDLISDRTRTPFNIGTAIKLTGFTFEEATPLIAGLVGSFQQPKIVLKEILHWTGGQPFLTQKVCKLAVERANDSGICPLPSYEDIWVRELIIEKIIDNWESQDEPVHLKTIRDRLLRNTQTASRLLGLTEQILRQGFILADDSPEQRELLLTNLVVKKNARLLPCNLIYEQIFNLDWLARQADKLRPFGREVELWLASNGEDKSRLLRGLALKEAQAWANHHSISQQEYQFLTASQKQQEQQKRQDLEFKRLQEVETRLIEEQKVARLQRFLLSTVGMALILTGGLGAIAYSNYRQAKINEVTAKTKEIEAHITSSESLFDADRRFESLLDAIEAKDNAVKFLPLDESISLATDLTLEQAAFNIIEKNTFTGHKDVVNSVDYSPDGKLIISASSDNTVKTWQSNGKLIATLRGHEDTVIDVAFSPDGRTIASGGEDSSVRLWTSGGKLKQTLTGHRGSVHKVAFSPIPLQSPLNKARSIPPQSPLNKGGILATASGDRTVRLWQSNGKLLRVLRGHNQEVLTVTFSRDGKLIATGDRGGNLKLWTAEGVLLHSFQAHKLAVRGIDFDPLGGRIVTGGDDNVARVWQISGELINTLTGYDASVTGVEFSPDGKIIGTSSWDGTVKLWHPDGTLHSNFKGHQGRVWRLSWSADGSTIASAGWDNAVKLWQIKDPLVQTFYGHKATVLSVVFHPQGNLIASASDDRTVKLWHSDGRIQTDFRKHTAETYEVSFSNDGDLVASSSLDRTIKLWHTNGQLLATSKGHLAPVSDAEFIFGDQVLVSVGYDRTLRFWKLDRQENEVNIAQQRSISAHKAIITDIAISRDGKLIASVSHDRYLKLWQPNGKLLKSIFADNTGVQAVAISGDGRTIATGGKEQNLKLWDLKGNLITTLEGHQAIVLDVEFSPDDSKIASASADNTIKIWNRQGKLLTTLRGHRGRVWDLDFSPDGSKIVSASEDKQLKIWDLERILQLDPLKYSCSWVRDYLKNNPQLQTDDNNICGRS
jgi:WD40 repeat protein